MSRLRRAGPVGVGSASQVLRGVPVREQRDRHGLAGDCQLVARTVAPGDLTVAVVVAPSAQACAEQWEEGASFGVRAAHRRPICHTTGGRQRGALWSSMQNPASDLRAVSVAALSLCVESATRRRLDQMERSGHPAGHASAVGAACCLLEVSTAYQQRPVAVGRRWHVGPRSAGPRCRLALAAAAARASRSLRAVRCGTCAGRDRDQRRWWRPSRRSKQTRLD